MSDTFTMCMTVSDGYTQRLRVGVNMTHNDEFGTHHSSQEFELPTLVGGQLCLEWLQQALAVICDAV